MFLLFLFSKRKFERLCGPLGEKATVSVQISNATSQYHIALFEILKICHAVLPRLYLIAVSGLGFGIISGAFSLINVLADSTGPGTIGIHGDSGQFFITSGMFICNCLNFVLQFLSCKIERQTNKQQQQQEYCQCYICGSSHTKRLRDRL